MKKTMFLFALGLTIPLSGMDTKKEIVIPKIVITPCISEPKKLDFQVSKTEPEYVQVWKEWTSIRTIKDPWISWRDAESRMKYIKRLIEDKKTKTKSVPPHS
jgi:hypothetical protein